MKQRNYTTSERAIIVIGIQAKASLLEINTLLMKEQQRLGLSPRTMPQSSYNIMKSKYLKTLDSQGIWAYIQNPKCIGDLQ